MKMYAIRNEKTGAYRKDEYGTIQAYTYAPLPSSCKKDEVVVELSPRPSKPCEWCDVNDGAWCATYDGRMIALDNEGSPETLLAENWSFCPNCGRRLA